MTCFCKLCDKSQMNRSKYKHFRPLTSKTLDTSFIRVYIIPNPIFDEINEILRRYNNFYNKKINNMRFVF